jgi:hypothetical protein
MMDARLDKQQNNVKQKSSRLQLPPMQRNSRHVPVHKMLMAAEVVEQQILKEVAPGEVEAQLADEPSLDKSEIGDGAVVPDEVEPSEDCAGMETVMAARRSHDGGRSRVVRATRRGRDGGPNRGHDSDQKVTTTAARRYPRRRPNLRSQRQRRDGCSNGNRARLRWRLRKRTMTVAKIGGKKWRRD